MTPVKNSRDGKSDMCFKTLGVKNFLIFASSESSGGKNYPYTYFLLWQLKRAPLEAQPISVFHSKCQLKLALPENRCLALFSLPSRVHLTFFVNLSITSKDGE